MYLSLSSSSKQLTQIKWRTDGGFISYYRSNIDEGSTGVLQCSVLRPLLFLIFINDLPLSVCGVVAMYANGSTVTVAGEMYYNDLTGTNLY